jgi:hypothetical protein
MRKRISFAKLILQPLSSSRAKKHFSRSLFRPGAGFVHLMQKGRKKEPLADDNIVGAENLV